VESILQHLSEMHPAFDDTIRPYTDRSVLRHGVGLRTDLMPKEGGKFAPKLLELDAATQRLSDVRFDLCEDPALSTLIVGHWMGVANTIEEQIKMDRFMGAEVVLASDAERKKAQAKKSKPAKKKRKTKADVRAEQATKRRRQACARDEALVAELVRRFPVLKDAQLEVHAEVDGSLKVKNHESGHCALKGGEHRNARDACIFVTPQGACTATCFHPACANQTFQLEPAVTEAVFGDAVVDFSTDLKAAALFKAHCLRGRAACLLANGKGMYMFDEATGLWSDVHKNQISYMISCELPNTIERLMAAQATAPEMDVARKFENVADANNALDRLVPMITDPRFADDLDAVPHVLSLENGLLDLKTLEVRPRRLEDKQTLCLSTAWPDEGVDYPTPLIDSFFKQLLGIKDGACLREEDRAKGSDDDEGLFEFVRVLLGQAALTGSTDAQVLTFLYGSDAGNGKTALMRLLANLLEDYALKCERKLITKCQPSNEGAANPAMMSLQGRRFGWCEEFGEEEVMSDERIKALTGGGKVRARQLNTPEVEFDMTTSFVLASNNKPTFAHLDQAIMRRLVMIACDTLFRDDTTEVEYDPANPRHRWRDPNIAERLGTLEGKQQLLVWLAVGAHAFYAAEGKLPPLPPSVSALNRETQMEQDHVGTFLAEACEFDSRFEKAQITDYCQWRRTTEQPLDPRYLYDKCRFAADFKEATGKEWSLSFERQLLKLNVGRRRLRPFRAYAASSCYVGIRPVGCQRAQQEADGVFGE
jgi:P4 family phage/plasmid primase-like protien